MKYPAYPRYKPSGVEWIGDIPEHWNVWRVKHTTYVKGRIGWQGLRFEEFTDDGPYLVTGTDFVDGKINWDTCYHITEERYHEDPYIQLKNGDLLITKDGTIGKVAIINNLQGFASLNSGVFVIRALKSIYFPEYLYWILTSEVFNGFIESMKTGTTIAHLYQNTFVEFSFPVPTLDEQQSIVKFLAIQISKLDALLAKKRELIEKLEEKRAALISRAVTRGLPPDAARATGLNPYPKLKPSRIEWIGEVPEHWEVKKVTFGFQRIGSGTTPRSDSEDYYDGNIPWVTTSELREKVILETKQMVTDKAVVDHPTLYKYPKGTLLFALYGATIGRLGILGIPATVNQACCAFALPTLFNTRFLFYWLLMRKPILISLSTGGGQPNLSQEDLRQIRIPTPPLSEQKAIADYLDQETEEIERMITKVEEAIDRLQEYRSALITAAVTGKIDVREATV